MQQEVWMVNLFLAPVWCLGCNYFFRAVFSSPSSTWQRRLRPHRKTCVGWTKKNIRVSHSSPNCCVASPRGQHVCMCLASVWWFSVCSCVCLHHCSCTVSLCLCVGVYIRVSFTVFYVLGKKMNLSVFHFDISNLVSFILLHLIQFHWVVSCIL